MENNINNYYGENIEEMGKKVSNQHEKKQFNFFRRLVRQRDPNGTFKN